MPDGTGLDKFGKAFPDRMFDVGIAEEHAVTFCGGMATQGMKPIAAIYSTFLQRAFDQVFHDVAIMDLPVVFALDRGGIAGADGPTHHGIYDMAYLRDLPEHDLHGAEGRERAAAHAEDRRSRPAIRRRCATRAATASAWRWTRSCSRCRSARAR